MKREREETQDIGTLEAQKAKLSHIIAENVYICTNLEKKIATDSELIQTKTVAKSLVDAQITRLFRYYPDTDTEVLDCTDILIELATAKAQDIKALEQEVESLKKRVGELNEENAKSKQELSAIQKQINDCAKLTKFTEKELLLEYTHLAHYCYKQDGSFGDFPFHRVRQDVLAAELLVGNTPGVSLIDITPDEMQVYLRKGILNDTITRDTIHDFFGFDPDIARENRIKQNAEKVALLSQVEHYQYDENGNPSDTPLTLLKRWFVDTLGYKEWQLTACGLPQSFEQDLAQGRVTPVMINEAIEFDIEKAIAQRQSQNQTQTHTEDKPTAPSLCFSTLTTTPLASACTDVRPEGGKPPPPPPVR